MAQKSRYTIVCADENVELRDGDVVVLSVQVPYPGYATSAPPVIAGLLTHAGLLEVAEAIRDHTERKIVT